MGSAEKSTAVVVKSIQNPSFEIGLGDLPEGLSDQQIIALREICKGSNLTEAAVVADVDKGTVSRWKSKNAAFRTALTLLEEYRENNVKQELRNMADVAVLGLRLAIEQGDDPRLNLMLLKLLGFFEKPGDDRPTDD